MATSHETYSAPESDIQIEGDESEPYQPRIFSTKGRLGRLRYFSYGFIYLLVFYAAMIPVLFISGGLGSLAGNNMSAGILIPIIALYIVFIVAWVFLLRRRLHDLDKSGWVALVMLVPFVNFFFALYLTFWPGSPTANRFGPPPVKNHPGLWILAVFFIVFFFGGILAAVALPAYQDYKERAAAFSTE